MEFYLVYLSIYYIFTVTAYDHISMITVPQE